MGGTCVGRESREDRSIRETHLPIQAFLRGTYACQPTIASWATTNCRDHARNVERDSSVLCLGEQTNDTCKPSTESLSAQMTISMQAVDKSDWIVNNLATVDRLGLTTKQVPLRQTGPRSEKSSTADLLATCGHREPRSTWGVLGSQWPWANGSCFSIDSEISTNFFLTRSTKKNGPWELPE